MVLNWLPVGGMMDSVLRKFNGHVSTVAKNDLYTLGIVLIYYSRSFSIIIFNEIATYYAHAPKFGT